MSFFCTHLEVEYGEGNGTPLQYNGLENPMDGGAWWVLGLQRVEHGLATKQQTML